MQTIDIYSLPQIIFAHTLSRNQYRNTFSPHDNYIEVSYISSGELHIMVEDQHVVARQNDIICLLHNEYMQIVSDVPHSHHTVCARVDWAYLDAPVSGLYLPLLTPAFLNTAPICKLIDSFIYGHYSYSEVTVNNAYQFLTILTEINARHQQERSIPIPKSHLYVERAKKYVHKHLQEPITQAQVAAHLGISRGYLCSLFKDTQDISLMHYINRTKLEAIRQIMEREHLKLYEAAALFGYADPNYVSRIYKKMFQHNITNKPNQVH